MHLQSQDEREKTTLETVKIKPLFDESNLHPFIFREFQPCPTSTTLKAQRIEEKVQHYTVSFKYCISCFNLTSCSDCNVIPTYSQYILFAKLKSSAVTSLTQPEPCSIQVILKGSPTSHSCHVGSRWTEPEVAGRDGEGSET